MSELRLNIGCGTKRLDGYVGVDAVKTDAVDVVADVLDLPYDDNAADEILAVHVLEHVPLPLADDALAEWVRVLKPGGRLVIEVPCRDKVFAMIREGVIDPRMVLWPLYGEPRTMRSAADIHKWCWAKVELAQAMQRAGLTEIESEVPHFHVPARDMRLTGVKGGN